MNKHQKELLTIIEDAYRRKGAFEFADEGSYPTSYQHYGAALGIEIGRKYVDTQLDQARLLIEGTMSSVAHKSLVDQRRVLLRGRENELKSISAAETMAWKIGEFRGECLPIAKEMLRGFADRHCGKGPKGPRVHFDAGHLSVEVVVDYGCYRGNIDVDFRFPGLGFKMGSGIALCVYQDHYTRYSAGSDFGVRFGRFLDLAGALVNAVRGAEKGLSSAKTPSEKSVPGESKLTN